MLTLISNTHLVAKFPAFAKVVKDNSLSDPDQPSDLDSADSSIEDSSSDREVENGQKTSLVLSNSLSPQKEAAIRRNLTKFSKLLEYGVMAQASEDGKLFMSSTEMNSLKNVKKSV